MFQNILSTSMWMWAGLAAAMVLLPILIHLINRLRHRRVRWAAMEFLLASHRKNRNWVWLKQLLLLLSRIAVLLLILVAVGQVGCESDNMARLLGERVTHHYVLVDDSVSMSDTSGGASAIQHARQAMGMIADRVAGRNNHRLTVIRFSAADRMSNSPSAPTTTAATLPQADLNSRLVDGDINKAMGDVATAIEPTFLSTRPDTGLELVGQLIESRTDENAIVYVLSDFRNRDWQSHDSVKQNLATIESAGGAIELIRCARTPNTNLAITDLQADGSVRVAGVPLMMQVSVRNFGNDTVRKVQIQLVSAAYPDETSQDLVPESIDPELDELPTILIDEIPAGETVSRRFPVFFSRPGQHAIRATLQSDVVAADNQAWNVSRFDRAARVLVVEGPESRAARLISLALSPGDMTGLQVDTGSVADLRDAGENGLEQYETIFLLDVDRLEELAVQNLRRYLEAGGGVVFFSGPNCNLKHYTEKLYASGDGIFPVPLARVASVPEPVAAKTADIVVTGHPIFSSVMNVDNSPLDLVQVARVCQPPIEWSADQDNAATVIASVRGQTELPLMVEKSVGKGRVVATLTSAGGQWNNWLRNPTFPATLLLMQDHVSRGRVNSQRRLAGTASRWDLSMDRYRADVVFAAPADDEFGRNVWSVTATPRPDSSGTLSVQTGADRENDRPGIYETWLTTSQADQELSRQALNVDIAESDLSLLSRRELLGELGEVKARVVDWDQFGPASRGRRGTSLVRLILVLLIIALIAEQILAYSASFHPSTTHVRRRAIV
ncbi:MAG: BatA domain-containing protein [Pirellulaceae bacterium]